MFADRGKENAEFPRKRAGGAITALSTIGFCVVPTVNFAQQNLKAEARCDDALGGEQNNVQLWFYLRQERSSGTLARFFWHFSFA